MGRSEWSRFFFIFLNCEIDVNFCKKWKLPTKYIGKFAKSQKPRKTNSKKKSIPTKPIRIPHKTPYKKSKIQNLPKSAKMSLVTSKLVIKLSSWFSRICCAILTLITITSWIIHKCVQFALERTRHILCWSSRGFGSISRNSGRFRFARWLSG